MNQHIDFKHHADTAWQLTLRHLFSLVLLTLVTATVGILSLGLFAPAAMAGYISSILLMIRNGREPDLRDVFSQAHLAVPLLGFSLAAILLIVLGCAVLVVPGIAVSLAITTASLYVIPLMIDRDLGIVAAVKASTRMAMAPPSWTTSWWLWLLWGCGASVGRYLSAGCSPSPWPRCFWFLSTTLKRAAWTPPERWHHEKTLVAALPAL